jgi:hypothetical protein
LLNRFKREETKRIPCFNQSKTSTWTRYEWWRILVYRFNYFSLQIFLPDLWEDNVWFEWWLDVLGNAHLTCFFRTNGASIEDLNKALTAYKIAVSIFDTTFISNLFLNFCWFDSGIKIPHHRNKNWSIL